jgi:hypothetical protein
MRSMLDVASIRESVQTPDGRRLDLYLAGPPDGDVLLFHSGTPGVPIPYDPMTAAAAERGLRYVAYSRPGVRVVDTAARPVRRGRRR